MTRNGPIRILYCEHNVDGTVGGSYYSLLYLVKGLDRTRYEPIVVFYAPHALLSAFADAGVETHVWPKSDTFAFASRAGTRRWFTMPLRLAQKGLNVWRAIADRGCAPRMVPEKARYPPRAPQQLRSA